MELHQRIERAAARLGDQILHTPLLHSRVLSGAIEGQVYLKLESEQHTGSFKARGALNRLLCLEPDARDRGVITASSGNHAQGFARALEIAGCQGTVFMPVNASPAKIEAVRQYAAHIEFFGQGCLETELHARQVAEERGLTWVSPYNDWEVMAGQGTLAVEITRDLPRFDCLLGCVGGGGMMGGAASWVKHHDPGIRAIGCLPANSPEMKLSVEAGQIITIDDPMDTLSDGSAGGLEPGAVTFDVCRQVVDDYLLASEAQIADGIRFMLDRHQKVIEGAAAVPLACLLNNPDRFRGQTVVIIICGANIAMDKLRAVLSGEYPGTERATQTPAES